MIEAVIVLDSNIIGFNDVRNKVELLEQSLIFFVMTSLMMMMMVFRLLRRIVVYLKLEVGSIKLITISFFVEKLLVLYVHFLSLLVVIVNGWRR